MDKVRFAIAAGLTLLAAWASFAGPGSQPTLAARLRRPVAAAFLADGRWLCVANERSGSVSLIDLARSQVTTETTVGQRLTDLAVLPDGRHLLTVDEQKHELIALACDGSSLAVRTRLPVGPYPVRIVVPPDGQRAMVAALWSRRVDVIDLAPLNSSAAPPALRITNTIGLPFAPRNLCVLPGGQLVVADAFGGHLAVLDATGRLLAVHEINGHNLRGLAVRGQELLVAHQVLDQQAATTRQNIERGVLIANVLRSIPLDALLRPGANLDAVSTLRQLGAVGRGAGDPAGVTVVDGDQVAVALAGVNEVALLTANGEPRRVAVGRRPTTIVAVSPDQPLAILNTIDDSVSLLDSRRGVVTSTIALGPQPTLTPQDRGELLFHDARLARDGWMSCHSCHTDGHTNGLLADTLGDGTFGTPKRTLTLRHTALTDPWAWNGGMKYLHDQVEKSLTDTMHTSAVNGEQVADLVSFLHTLSPPPPLQPVTADAADREQVERGRQLFHDRGCVRCHIPPLTYTSHGAIEGGFSDERGLKKFNPPSLRGVGQGSRFLHDNRAATVEEVFTKHRHKSGADLSSSELEDLLRFLRSL